MITLTGECRGVIVTPARTGRDGTQYPERGQVQIETVETSENGDKIHLHTLYGDPSTVRRFEQWKGKHVTLPVRPYARGNAVSFALIDDAKPLRVTDAAS